MEIDYIDRIIKCLEQKNLFIVNILDITKQVEVRAQNDVADFENLLTQRGEFMQRIDKCSALIAASVDSVDESIRWKVASVLAGKASDDSGLSSMSALVKKYQAALAELVKADAVARTFVEKRHAELQDKVNETRIKRKNLYHF